LNQAKDKGVITPDQNGYVIAIIVLSLVLTPGLIQAARAASLLAARVPPARWVRASALRTAPSSVQDQPPDVDPATQGAMAIVAGFGPVGRAVADKLERHGVRITVVELNPRTVEKQQILGRTIVY